MKRSWTALAVVLAAVFAVAGCNDYGSTFQQNTGARLTFLSPRDIPAGSGDFTLTVNSTGGFVTKTVVQWNGQTLSNATTVVNGAVATVVVPAALIAKPGAVYVNTLSPHSGAQNNGLSNPVAFIIDGPPNPPPTITTIMPDHATACGTSCAGSDVALTIAGTNFLPTSVNGPSQVTWAVGSSQPLQLATVSITTMEIKATIPGAYLQSAVTATINVFDPTTSTQCTANCPPGGGTSNGAPFTVDPPPAAATASAHSALEETPALSHDGRFVAYAAMQNDHAQIFLRDTCLGVSADCKPASSLLSATPEGLAGDADSHAPSMSSDGRLVAFSSAAANLLSSATPGRQIYLRDTCLGADAACKPSLQLISTDSDGALVGTESILPSVSASGRFVAFIAITPSHAVNKLATPSKSSTATPNSGYRQVFIRDTCLGAVNCTPKTTRISLQPGDAPATGEKPAGPALSGAAKHLALAGGRTSTLFTRSVAVDDSVFLAISNNQQ